MATGDIPILQISNLETSYGQIRAVRDVSLQVGAGEVVALLGANGAGKTTLLRTVSGVVRASQGRVEFEGRAIHTLDPHTIVRAGIGHVPEGREVWPLMTVRENLVVGSHLRRDRDQVARDIETYQRLFPVLKERANVAAGLLSGGQQQMLAIARAMMSRPKLLLMDEPSLGLSPLLTSEIFEIVRKLNAEQGIAILLVEQNVKRALGVAHRGVVLATGRVAAQGTSAELLARGDLSRIYLGGHAKAVHA
ncbi:MAG: livF 17 [Rhizobacter sp.]|nr:livF 17 [Rhizobacter sp.]